MDEQRTDSDGRGHVHSYAAYHHNRRCWQCAEEASRARAARKAAIAAGAWQPYANAAPVRDHIAYLRDHGIGARRLAELAGVGRTSIQAILSGRPRCLTTVARAILAIQPARGTVAPGAQIPCDDTRRQLRDLVAAHGTQAAVAELLGWTPGNLNLLFRQRRVTVRTAQMIAALHASLASPRPDSVATAA